MVSPVLLRFYVWISPYLDNVATLQLRLDGCQLPVDSCIMGMFANVTVNFKGEVKSRSLLGQVHGLSLGSKDHDIVVIECCHDIIHITTFFLMELQVAKNLTELVYPQVNRILTPFCYDTYLVITYHAFAADVDFLPGTKLREQLYMIGLISIFFCTIVDIANHGTRFFIKNASQSRVDFQCNIFLLAHIFAGEDNLHYMTEWNVAEIIARLLHLTPDAIWCTEFGLHENISKLFTQDYTDFVCKVMESSFVAQLIPMKQSCYFLVLMGTAITKTEVFKFYLNGVHTKSVCQWSVEEIGLSGNLHLLVRWHTAKRPHIVKTVCQLDKECSDVIVDCVEHLLVVVNLLRHLILFLSLLCQRTDKEGYIFTEPLQYIIDGKGGILYHVMQERCNNRISSQLQLFGNNTCHSNGVDDIGFSRLTFLPVMSLTRKLESLTDTCHVRLGNSLLHYIEDFISLRNNHLVVILLHNSGIFYSYYLYLYIGKVRAFEQELSPEIKNTPHFSMRGISLKVAIITRSSTNGHS